jgi:hypothetical protein
MQLLGAFAQVVFVSSDRDENDFGGYFKTMPWLALPFGDRNRKVCPCTVRAKKKKKRNNKTWR